MQRFPFSASGYSLCLCYVLEGLWTKWHNLWRRHSKRLWHYSSLLISILGSAYSRNKCSLGFIFAWREREKVSFSQKIHLFMGEKCKICSVNVKRRGKAWGHGEDFRGIYCTPISHGLHFLPLYYKRGGPAVIESKDLFFYSVTFKLNWWGVNSNYRL